MYIEFDKGDYEMAYETDCLICANKTLRVDSNALNQATHQTCGTCGYYCSRFVDVLTKTHVYAEGTGIGTVHVVGRNREDRVYVCSTKDDMRTRLRDALVKQAVVIYVTLKVDGRWNSFAVRGDSQELAERFDVKQKLTSEVFARAEDAAPNAVEIRTSAAPGEVHEVLKKVRTKGSRFAVKQSDGGLVWRICNNKLAEVA